MRSRETMNLEYLLRYLNKIMEKGKDDPIGKASEKLAKKVFHIPKGMFSGLSTYVDKGEYGQEKRISPLLDKLLAEQYTNHRYIVKKINKIGAITSKDPREKYEGEIDEVIEKTKKCLSVFQVELPKIKEYLENKRKKEKISEQGYKKGKQLLKDVTNVYHALLKELELKRRGFKLLKEKKIISEKMGMNIQLEIRHLPGGQILILRGYSHDELGGWQQFFGDNRYGEIGLANIYAFAQYIAIEGYTYHKYGKSLKRHWKISPCIDGEYNVLMQKLIQADFSGKFIEFDARFAGEKGEKSFDNKDTTDREAALRFNFLQKFVPSLAQRIGTATMLKEFIHLQRTQPTQNISETEKTLAKRGTKEGLTFVENGTYYHETASVKKDLTTSSLPTGFELGQAVFSDALSVIKILLLNNAIQERKMEPGVIVDFQGAGHQSYKSYFFEHPEMALRVVLTNLNEILASHPDIHSTDDILDKMQNIDKKTWRWVLEFIGTLFLAEIAKPTKFRKYTEPTLFGLRQRPIHELSPYSVLNNLDQESKHSLNEILTALTS